MAEKGKNKELKLPPQRLWGIGLGFVLAALAVALLYALRHALTPVLAALLLAYLLDPVVRRVERLRLNRSAAILILAGVTLLGFGLAAALVLFQVQRELVELLRQLPDYLARIQPQLDSFARQYLGYALPATLEEALVELKTRLGQVDPASLMPASQALAKVAAAVSSRTAALLVGAASLVIIPVLLFYFLRDWDALLTRAVDSIPPRHRAYVTEKAGQIDTVLGAFIRGQLTICAILGALYSLGLLLLGVDLAVVIGLAAGAALIVPYLGTILGVVAASLMALLEFGLGWHLLGVWMVFGLVQLAEGSVLTPRIMGQRVGLSPVSIILALLVGAELLGFLGILLAVPTAAVLNVLAKDALARYRKSAFFRGSDSGDDRDRS